MNLLVAMCATTPIHNLIQAMLGRSALRRSGFLQAGADEPFRLHALSTPEYRPEAQNVHTRPIDSLFHVPFPIRWWTVNSIFTITRISTGLRHPGSPNWMQCGIYGSVPSSKRSDRLATSVSHLLTLLHVVEACFTFFLTVCDRPYITCNPKDSNFMVVMVHVHGPFVLKQCTPQQLAPPCSYRSRV